ncbi:2,5-dichloro-2,5-cyclohexadiene-1,4-diol dehydrogenase LinX-like [Babylonia areolata]|uniref:2,5-dichloro-2,5-cyclohexadiene-1,4-diol dehydrogenase LinX-like n=1 Tax=Babylonia areolata TaxID=304850 RepID=UPI003FD35371
MEQFTNKVFLITGSSAGIGAGVAQYLAARGARLSLTGRDDSKLDNVKQKCVEAGLKPADVLTLSGDLTDDKFRSQLVSSTVQTFGQLDVLVNNAGMAKAGMVSDPGMEEYMDVFNLNLHSQVAMAKLAVPHLLRSKGNIVNISSNLSLRPSAGLGAYCMSKAALDMCTKVLALELAPKGVRVNSINPGCVRSDIYRSLGMDTTQYAEFLKDQVRTHPVGRVGVPEDIAHAVAFLASDQSSFITGEILAVDGCGRYGSSEIM